MHAKAGLKHILILRMCYKTSLLNLINHSDKIPYISNNLQKKVTQITYLLGHSSQENFHDSGKLIYKLSSQDKNARKHPQMLPDSRNS